MKKEKVNKIFESIADKYDLMNDLMSLGLHRTWKKEFVKKINLNKRKNLILDLGCGTGDIFNEINNKYKNYKSSIFLVDPNIEMIKLGKKKIKKKNAILLNSYG